MNKCRSLSALKELLPAGKVLLMRKIVSPMSWKLNQAFIL
jgi:hypothetical protein